MVRDLRIAVDIGGTFTDVVLEEGGKRLTRKLLTTPQRPEEAVLDGVRLILADAGRGFGDVAVFVHGTTLATNAVIERRGARTALLATEGFRDVLDIANESRYDQYDLTIEKPKPLVPRALRFTVPERMDVHGHVRLALDEKAVRVAARKLEAEGAESVAVAFMHAYANPAHERRTRDILKEELPGLWVTLSSEVCPEVREYERTSTAVANAYVQPLMDSYLERMQAALAAEKFAGTIYLVTSGGGLTAIATARRYPVRLIESGPAGGAIFAAQVAARAGEARALSYDMGGTTAKICLIDDYKPHTARLFEIDRAARFLKGSGLPVRIPVIEMVEIGAGGGSIARLDALKRVTVGPESAGAEPGPACYGRGGTHPAVTDANVVLGTIDPHDFAGGSIKLDLGAAKGALERDVAEGLGLSTEMAAYAVYEMVSENMASAARVHAVERGAVVNQYNLIAFGGGAPLHAARVAEKIGVKRVIVPPNAGVGSAVGFLAAPVSYELVRSRYMRLDAFDADAASELLKEMSAEATALVAPGCARHGDLRAPHGLHALCRPGPRDRGRAAAAAPAGVGRPGAARGLRARLRRAVRAPHPQRRHRDPELVGPGLDRGQAAGKAGRGARRAAAQAGRQAAGVRRPQRPHHRGSGLSPRGPAAGQRLPGAGHRRRGRDLDLYFGQFCRAYRCLRLYRHGPQGRVRKA